MPSFELPGDQPENRQWLTRALATIARQEIQRPLDPIAVEFSHSRAAAPRFNTAPQSPYARVAERLQREFILKAMASDDEALPQVAVDPSVEAGCLVIAKTLRYAPLGYLAYTADQNQSPNIAELEEALRKSSNIVRKFAETDRDRARIYEETLNIYPLSDVEPYEPQPFAFAQTAEGLRYVVSTQSLDHADARIVAAESAGELPQVGKHRKCAALGAVMEGLWSRAVDICVEGPSLFPNDLSPEPVIYPTNFPYTSPNR